MALLEVQDLDVTFFLSYGELPAVRGSSFSLDAGETLGIVGETGSGKTMTALAIMGLVPPPGRITGGSIVFKGESLLHKPESALRRMRAREISLVSQDPMTSLNPTMTVGDQVAEMFHYHLGYGNRAAWRRVVEILRQVGMPHPEEMGRRYPHELSGGMRQRVSIAIALACEPRLVIADEPTSALDVTIQAQILTLLKELQARRGLALLFISHDLGVVSKLADRVMVMYAGKPVEQASAVELFERPMHPYTEALLDARPRKGSRDRLRPIGGSIPDLLELPSGCAFHPRCLKANAHCRVDAPALLDWRPGHRASCHYPAGANGASLREFYLAEAAAPGPGENRQGARNEASALRLRVNHLRKQFELAPLVPDRIVGRHRLLKAVDNVSFGLAEGRTLGVVGESGCGKTTLARILLRLLRGDGGEALFEGKDILRFSKKQVRRLRKDMQAVYQDPFSSLPPRMTVRQILSRPLRIHFGMDARQLEERLVFLMDSVGMTAEQLDRYPHEFSGGQRQRIAIARALAPMPKVIIADEPVSALDVSVQAQVLNLLNELRRSWGFDMIFVSHDLAVIYQVSDDVMVMYGGKVMEHGPTADVFKDPLHPYTGFLLDAALEPDPYTPMAGTRLAGEPSSPINPGVGCRFASRCPLAEEACRATHPPLEQKQPGRWVACLKI